MFRKTFGLLILMLIVVSILFVDCSFLFGPKIRKTRPFGPIEKSVSDNSKLASNIQKESGSTTQRLEIIVIGSVVNIRKGPGTNYEIIGKCSKGQKYDILEEKGNWIKIRFDADKLGWVYSKLVTKS